MCDCFMCTYKDKPELLLKFFEEQLSIYQYYLKVFKFHKVRKGNLYGSLYTYRNARCITEDNIEELTVMIDEIKEILNVHNTKST